MKNLGPLLAGGLTVLLVLGVGIFSFAPAEQSAQVTTTQSAKAASSAPITELIGPSGLDTSPFETTIAQREATYQAQIAELNRALQERQNTYQSQIQEVTALISTVNSQLNELKAQEQSLQAQVAQLENTRAERLATYQNQLQQAQDQYSARYAQLQAQLDEARSRLAEANAQLGR